MENKTIDTNLGKIKFSFKLGDPFILFLNGTGNFDTEQTFRPVIEKLDDDFGILAIDYLNCGLSGMAKRNYTVEDQVNIFINIIEKLNPKHLIIVAHSIGGIFALRLAQKLDSVIGFLGIEPTTKEILVNSPKSKKYLKKMTEYSNKSDEEIEFMIHGWINKYFKYDWAHQIWKTFLDNAKRNPKYPLIHLDQEIKNNDLYKLDSSIKSVIITEAFRSDEYHRSEYATNNFKVCKMGDFHYLHWEYPSLIAKKLNDWI